MTKEEAMCWLHNPEDEKCYNAYEVEAYDMAIKALEQEQFDERKKMFAYLDGVADGLNNPLVEPCEDVISRKDTLKKFKQIYFDNDTVIRCAELILGSMPPVTPQPKTGKWIAVENDEMETVGYYCSECDLPMETELRTNFCPNCGAKMESEEV